MTGLVIIEKPKSCADCRFLIHFGNGIMKCSAKEKGNSECPIVDMPEAHDWYSANSIKDVGFIEGWNAFRGAILNGK